MSPQAKRERISDILLVACAHPFIPLGEASHIYGALGCYFSGVGGSMVKEKLLRNPSSKKSDTNFTNFYGLFFHIIRVNSCQFVDQKNLRESV